MNEESNSINYDQGNSSEEEDEEQKDSFIDFENDKLTKEIMQ